LPFPNKSSVDSPKVICCRVYLGSLQSALVAGTPLITSDSIQRSLTQNLQNDFRQDVPDHEERIFITTGKLIGEGFDDSRLDTLFLVHPISWRGTLQQYVSRLHQTHQNKKEVQVYDYVEIQVPMLMNMYKKRIKGYQAMGYSGMSI